EFNEPIYEIVNWIAILSQKSLLVVRNMVLDISILGVAIRDKVAFLCDCCQYLCKISVMDLRGFHNFLCGCFLHAD
ncbi:hypothetical protein MKW98_018117, partial [Papaver atlanticum]